MRVYRCFARLEHVDDYKNKRTAAVWYTRKGDNIKSEKAIKAIEKNKNYHIVKFVHKELDLPKTKAGLVGFLNKYCRR